MYVGLKMKSLIAAIFFVLISSNSYAQNNNCISALENVVKEVNEEVEVKNKNMLTGAIALEKRGIFNETVNIEVLAMFVYGISAHSLGLGNQVIIKNNSIIRASIAKDIDGIILNHANAFYTMLKRTKERFDNEIPAIKNNNLRDDARIVRDAVVILMKKYKACEV